MPAIRNEPLLKPAPRGLPRPIAAAYIGVGTSKFDELVNTGMMPKPKRIGGRVIWDIRQLDVAFDELPSDGNLSDNPWDING